MPLLFPAARGGHVDLEKFRHREWTPRLRAAGIAHRRIYDLRHTYATWSLAAGVDPFHALAADGDLASDDRRDVWALAPDADERERVLLSSLGLPRPGWRAKYERRSSESRDEHSTRPGFSRLCR
jgi:integrase